MYVHMLRLINCCDQIYPAKIHLKNKILCAVVFINQIFVQFFIFVKTIKKINGIKTGIYFTC